MRHLGKQSGFTLVEVIMASAIFVTAMVAVADMFASINNSQRKTQSIQETSTDARFAFEAMAREARLAAIDYSYYSGSLSASGESVLALRNTTNQPIRFSTQTDPAICPSGSSACLAVCIVETCTTGDWVSLTPKNVEVGYLLFYIEPLLSPFVSVGSGFQSNIQPRVTIVMQTSSTKQDDASQGDLRMQTTVSSRRYLR